LQYQLKTPNPDKPFGTKWKSRFIGEPKNVSRQDTKVTAESKEHRAWRKNKCYALCTMRFSFASSACPVKCKAYFSRAALREKTIFRNFFATKSAKLITKGLLCFV